MRPRKILLLVNLGTPDAPDRASVRRYLAEFLSDRRVIALPGFLRFLLVRLIIVPFRAGRSSRRYRQLWTPQGSPLRVHTDALAAKLADRLGDSFQVVTAMRYGQPSLEKVLADLEQAYPDEITVLPLFPQYASSTTGSIFEKVMEDLRSWQVIPALRFIPQFHRNPGFIEALAGQIRLCHPEEHDYLVFSYHGLPYNHLRPLRPELDCRTCDASMAVPACGSSCYKAACQETTRLLVARLGLEASQYTVAFQSRMAGNWLAPFTDTVLDDLAGKGLGRVLIATPSFVTDCLETNLEVGTEYEQRFLSKGGRQLTRVESLNAGDALADALGGLVRSGGEGEA